MPPQKQPRRALSPPPPPPPPPPVLLEELILEILSWLPVKSLLRFRCVCKSWKSLISNPHFVKLHLHRSTTNPNFTHHRLTSEPYLNDFHKRSVVSCAVSSFLENPSSPISQNLGYLYDTYWLVGSCNGLICLATRSTDETFAEHWVHLWNPATSLISKESPCFYVNWESDGIVSPDYGFGYDHVSDTYKVVAMLSNPNAKESQVKVYSLGDTCWRKIQNFPVVPTGSQNNGVYLSGTLNWVAVRNLSASCKWDNVSVDQLVIVSLDLGKEAYSQLLLPRGVDEVPNVDSTLGVLRECLCVSHDCKRTHFVVWQMKEFGVEKSWTLLVKLSYVDLQTGSLEFNSMLLPLCLCENGDVLMLSKFAEIESRTILYKRRDNSLEHSEVLDIINWIHPQVYVESLVRPW